MRTPMLIISMILSAQLALATEFIFVGHQITSPTKEGIPLEKCMPFKKGHCCFSSILARIINEQGEKIQQTLSEEIKCGGFTPEEFQTLEINKMDLSAAINTPSN